MGLLCFFFRRYCVAGKRRKKRMPKMRRQKMVGLEKLVSPPSWRPIRKRRVAVRIVVAPSQSIERRPARKGVRGLGRVRVV